MILKSPRNQNKDSPPASPSPSPAGGSTPPVSPFSGKLFESSVLPLLENMRKQEI